jgi:hypothetical protein
LRSTVQEEGCTKLTRFRKNLFQPKLPEIRNFNALGMYQVSQGSRWMARMRHPTHS